MLLFLWTRCVFCQWCDKPRNTRMVKVRERNSFLVLALPFAVHVYVYFSTVHCMYSGRVANLVWSYFYLSILYCFHIRKKCILSAFSTYSLLAQTPFIVWRGKGPRRAASCSFIRCPFDGHFFTSFTFEWNKLWFDFIILQAYPDIPSPPGISTRTYNLISKLSCHTNEIYSKLCGSLKNTTQYIFHRILLQWYLSSVLLFMQKIWGNSDNC